ncbi:hypothetical protein [uncultured Tateyamaria sp.]|uniref:hypothetical protein n=1 Tax=uncultured Tateyamaria sp. TaxID=455651 RepID=UPI002636147E|nr:hypothetical protein [uncultured Tateyamaria sp.]
MEFHVKPSVCWCDLDVVDQALDCFDGLQPNSWVIQPIRQLPDLGSIYLTDVVDWNDRGLRLTLANFGFKRFLFSFQIIQLICDALITNPVHDVLDNAINLTSDLTEPLLLRCKLGCIGLA